MTNTEQTPEHIRTPHLRPIQPVPMMQDGRTIVVLRDPSMLVDQTMAVPAPMMAILQRFRGEETIDDIASSTGAPLDKLIELIENLDRLGLIWGPTFNSLEDQLRERVESAGFFPKTASASLGDTDEACRSRLEELFDGIEDPELEGQVVGIVAPHLDYERGARNYAAAYDVFRSMDRPDRVVVLGTNHFGIGDGVVLSPIGFETPMGVCPVDRPVIDHLVKTHGRALIIDQLDHMGEHSIELHLPWLQYCFGPDVPIVAALVPSPLDDPVEDNDDRTDTTTFIVALREALDAVGGTTLFVASSDLSHVGPQFGEPRPVDEQRQIDVERHDRDMLAKYVEGDPESFVEAFKWNRNPSRWCSIGNMAATLELARPTTVELLEYHQATDEQGNVMVSSASMVLLNV